MISIRGHIVATEAKTSGASGGTAGVGRHAARPDWSADRGQAHKSDGWDVVPHGSFGLRAEEDDPLVRSDVIDLDGAEPHGDESSGTAEFAENAANEVGHRGTEETGFFSAMRVQSLCSRLDASLCVHQSPIWVFGPRAFSVC
jgi:hypothetical protein